VSSGQHDAGKVNVTLTIFGTGANPTVPTVEYMTRAADRRHPRDATNLVLRQDRSDFAYRLRLAAVLALPLAAVIAGCSGQRNAAAPKRPASAPTNGASQSAPAAAASSAGVVASQSPAPVESSPPGDIPDNVAYVAYHNTAGRYSFVHPEGWASVARGMSVTFTDKLNGITATTTPLNAPPTVATAKQDVTTLKSSQPAFELRAVRPASLPGGSGVLIVFRRNSAPDAVTGKVFRDEVNRYEIYGAGHELVLDLYGAVGSDNVDPYTKISQSLRLS